MIFAEGCLAIIIRTTRAGATTALIIDRLRSTQYIGVVGRVV